MSFKIHDKVNDAIEWIEKNHSKGVIPSERYYEKLGIGRGKMREAMTVLEFLGMVKATPGKGRELIMPIRQIKKEVKEYERKFKCRINKRTS